MFFKSTNNSMIISSKLHERLLRSHPKETLEGEVVGHRSHAPKKNINNRTDRPPEPEPARTRLIGVSDKKLKKVAGY